MFRYNWNKLFRFCNENPNKVLQVLNEYNSGEVTKANAKIIAKLSRYAKPHYIRDLDALLKDSGASDDDKLLYLYIAAKRNVINYLLYDNDRLHIGLIDVDIEKLKHNTLFVFNGNYVYFKY